MMIERAAPPRILRRSRKQIVAAVISAGGEWVRIDPSDLSGAYKSAKAANLQSAAYRQGARFQTKVADGFVYVRLRQTGGERH
jgi:hypothetical protein